MKATNYALAAIQSFVAQSGPTNQQQPPFDWSKSDYRDSLPHSMQPDLWQFDPIVIRWTTVKDPVV